MFNFNKILVTFRRQNRPLNQAPFLDKELFYIFFIMQLKIFVMETSIKIKNQYSSNNGKENIKQYKKDLGELTDIRDYREKIPLLNTDLLLDKG